MGTGDLDTQRRELRDRAAKLLAADYFQMLGVPRAASAEDVKRAFVAAAKAWHPDRLPPGLEDMRPKFAEVFTRLDEARATLADAAKRAAYVAAGASPSAGRIPAGATTEAALEYRKGETFMKKNDLASAEPHLRRAITLAPLNHDYQAALVWLMASKPDCDLGKVRGLVAELDKILQKADRCERAYFYRAMLRKRLDLIPEATSDFAKAAELNPQNVDAAREVRLSRMRQERQGKAAPKTAGSAPGEGVGGFLRKLFKR